MAKPISKSHQEFIRLVVSGRSQQDAYRLSVGKKGVRSNVCDVKGSQLAKRYASDIASERERLASVVQAANDSESVKEALKSVLSQAQVDAKLCSIINGTFEYEDVVPVNGKLMKLKRQPNANETAKAIDLYNKRFGSNAPTKAENVQTIIIPELTAEEREQYKKDFKNDY